MKGFIVHPKYEVRNGKAHVHLYGRLENNDSFVAINEFRPYFFIKKSDLKKALKISRVDYEDAGKVKLKNFKGKPVVKLVFDIPSQVKEFRDRLLEEKIKCYEADIRFEYRFMFDKRLQGGVDIRGDYKKGDFTDRVYENPELSPADYCPENLKVLGIDIETDKKVKELYSISLYSNDFKKVIIRSDKKLKNAVNVKNEREILLRFQDLLVKHDPDIITGWNVIDFDLRFLQDKFRHYNIPFKLGRSTSECRLRIFQNFLRDSRADFAGRMVLDGIYTLKNNFIGLPDYKLETAANTFLEDSKIFKGEERYTRIEKAFKDDPQLLVDYNLQDSKLAHDILYKSGAFELSIQRSLLTGMPLDRVSASIASLDSLYLKELRKRGFVAPTSLYSQDAERGKGGYVMNPKPGIYNYVIVCDFKSLYPSIIRTFNIDPLGFVHGCKGKNLVKAPNGACFRNEDGVLPMIIQGLWEQRDKARKQKDELARYAIKILMNSFFGVLGNENCRFHNKDISNAITYFGQSLIKLTAKKIRDMNYEVIYGDTDSVFINLDVNNYKEAARTGKEIADKLNSFFSKYTREEYERRNFLDLEFEKVYKRFLMPRIRRSEIGSKKRYAGLLIDEKGKEKMDIVGLEFVRRDWTIVARHFQQELLDRIFHKKEVADYVKKLVDEVKQGKHDDQLVYRKALRKPVDEYVKTTPPHVKAAKILGDDLKSNLIEYVITKNGPEPVQKQKHSIDYEHYIEKQLKPIADSILVFYNTSFDDVLKGSSQKKLLGFE